MKRWMLILMIMLAFLVSWSGPAAWACSVCSCPDCGKAKTSMNCMPQDNDVATPGAVSAQINLGAAQALPADGLILFPSEEIAAWDATTATPAHVPLFLQLQTLLI